MDLNVNQVKCQIRKFRSVLCTRHILPCHAAYITSMRAVWPGHQWTEYRLTVHQNRGFNRWPLWSQHLVKVPLVPLLPSPCGPTRGCCPNNLGRSGHVHTEKNRTPREKCYFGICVSSPLLLAVVFIDVTGVMGA